MPCIYVRVPHYVASYLRLRNESAPIEVGTPFRMDLGDPWYVAFIAHAEPNLRNDINIDCFSERQWLTMRRGTVLSPRTSLVADVPKKRRGEPLTMSEVYALSGHEELVRYDEQGAFMPDVEYPDEYVAFQMPSVIVRHGRECRVFGDWYLPSAKDFIAALRTQFKMIYVKFVAHDQYYANALAAINPMQMSDGEAARFRTRARMESIDRFMLRYEIRAGDRERETLKKILTRAIKQDAYALDADANHAGWTAQLPAQSCRKIPVTARKIFVLETGKTYPSINATLRAFGCDVTVANRNNLARAIKRNYRFHGVRLQYADIPEPERKQRAEPDEYVIAMQRNRDPQ